MFGIKVGVCKVCGCTDNRACLTEYGPCSWANDEEDLCSACHSKEPETEEEKQAARLVELLVEEDIAFNLHHDGISFHTELDSSKAMRIAKSVGLEHLLE